MKGWHFHSREHSKARLKGLRKRENKKTWILINRLHVNDRNGKNNWLSLEKYLGVNLKRIEDTKAMILVDSNKVWFVKRKIENYNNYYHTDFFI